MKKTSDKQALTRRLLEALRGGLIFFLIVAGTTYYLQSSLVLYKNYGAHLHWVVVLIAVPLVAGLLLRVARVCYPLICTAGGALAAAALLYPQYKSFWAVPPTLTHVIIYITIVLGFGFIATQPLRTTIMMAFHLGRFAAPMFTPAADTPSARGTGRGSRGGPGKSASASKKTTRKSTPTATGRLQASHGSMIALLELMVGVTSLVLSIFSIFFLGRS